MRRGPILVFGALGLLLGPVPTLRGQTRSAQPHGEIKLDCGQCHNPERWVPVEHPAFRHETTGFALESAHAKASCRSCHRTLVFARVGVSCADCHRDAHRGELGLRCESCHAPTGWNTQRAIFRAHDRSRFPLMAVHARLDCTACHRSQAPYEYANTPAECGNCHYSTYLATSSPNHAASGFSRRCEDCHRATAASWHEASFSHPGSFPLQGGHAGLACARCHGAGSPRAVSSACVSCHQGQYQSAASPNHLAGRFPMTCESCHTIVAWRPARFDHDQTGFSLTGAHGQTDCAKCHVGGRYAGTPSDCYACHQSNYAATTNPNHASSGFPTSCQDCHNTSAWRPASFNHDGPYFPIYSGNHRGKWSSCADCHVNAGNYRVFECILCHEHANRADLDGKHRGVSGYAYASASCYQCHRSGRAGSFGHVRRLP